ncbi:MAG: hypothetical protein KF746_06090 [Chitinophagaceae bacterium]|nr:hypothetical protein [Chitinophagaceae bacterium]
MFNNAALDIAIGLIFIFVLYSLLATAIHEFIATLFAYRHRMLDIALEQMLDGRHYSYYWWNKIGNIFWWLFARFIRKKKPATFIDAGGDTMLKFTDFTAKQNLTEQQIKTLQTAGIRRNVLNKKAALFAANITEHPLYKRSAENSVFYKKPAYLSADVFSDMLIDVLGKKASAPVLLKDIKNNLDDLDERGMNPELKNILTIYINQANGDMVRFKGLIEDWYNQQMDRVKGWYKRQTSRILLVIGFALAIAFNVNTIQIAGKLAENDKARDKLAQQATEWVKANPSIPASANLIDSTLSDSAFKVAKQNFLKASAAYQKEIDSATNLLGMGWGSGVLDREISYRQLCWIEYPVKLVFDFIIPDAALSVYYEITRNPAILIGFLITAFAVSFGAPFWFDLLNKVVNIRSAGKNPNEKSGTATTPAPSKTPLLNKHPDSDSFG